MTHSDNSFFFICHELYSELKDFQCAHQNPKIKDAIVGASDSDRIQHMRQKPQKKMYV